MAPALRPVLCHSLGPQVPLPVTPSWEHLILDEEGADALGSGAAEPTGGGGEEGQGALRSLGGVPILTCTVWVFSSRTSRPVPSTWAPRAPAPLEPKDPRPRPPSQVDHVPHGPHPPMHVFPSVWSTNLTWQPQRGPCSVSSQVCWQPPLP